MNDFDKFSRQLEQSEASIATIGNLVVIMWHSLDDIPPEYKVEIIVKWIELSIQGNFTDNCK